MTVHFLGPSWKLQLATGTRNICVTQKTLWNTWAAWVLSSYVFNLRKLQPKILKNQIFVLTNLNGAQYIKKVEGWEAI